MGIDKVPKTCNYVFNQSGSVLVVRQVNFKGDRAKMLASKGIRVWAIVVLVVVSLLFAACSAPAPKPTTAPALSPTPTAKPTPAPTSTPVPATKAIKLRFSDFSPLTEGRTAVNVWWMDEIEKRSNGRVTFEKYWAEALGTGRENLYVVGKGIADMGAISTHFPGDLPLWSVGQSMPGLTGDFLVALFAGSIISRHPLIEAEFTRSNVRSVLQCGGMSYHLAGRYPFMSVEELKGTKLRASGAWSFLCQRVGAMPVDLASGEIYEALQRRTIDGLLMSLEVTVRYSWHQVIKYFTYWDLGASPTQNPILVNLDTWKKLPSDIRGIIENLEFETERKLAAVYAELDAGQVAQAKQAGVQFLNAPEAERAKLNNLAKAIQDDWVDRMNKKGLRGREIMDAMLAAVAQAQKELKKS